MKSFNMPQQTLEISIITVNYNGFQETCELIESLQESIHSCHYELIVVDNGSRQNEAQQLQQKYPHIHTIRSEKNRGFAGGNNLGIRKAQGKYIFLLNNDTLLKDDQLHFLCDRLENHPSIGAVSPKIKFAYPPYNIQFAGFTPMSKYTLRNQSIGYNEADTRQYDIAQPTSFLHGAALMFKREILNKVGEMPEIFFLYYEEIDWCSHIVRAGYQLWYDPRCTVYHKESCSTGQNSPLKSYYMTRNRLLYARRNRQGISCLIAIVYQVCIANPKNIIVHLLQGKGRQAYSVLKGCVDFFFLKNKLN